LSGRAVFQETHEFLARMQYRLTAAKVMASMRQRERARQELRTLIAELEAKNWSQWPPKRGTRCAKWAGLHPARRFAIGPKSPLLIGRGSVIGRRPAAQNATVRKRTKLHPNPMPRVLRKTERSQGEGSCPTDSVVSPRSGRLKIGRQDAICLT